MVVVECSISYNDGPWQFGVQLLEFRDDKVALERIYVMEGWDAPEWRRHGGPKRLPTHRGLAEVGKSAPRGIRTPDLLIRSQTLYPD